MRAIKLTLSAFVLALALAAPAAAQDRPEIQPDTTFDFSDELVTGDYLSPDLEQIHARRPGSHQSLIRPRAHFVPELLTSVQGI